MLLPEALAYVSRYRHGVLATVKADGRPQMSNIVFSVTDAGVLRISTTVDRAKAVNIRRDPRVSVHVTSVDFRSYVVIDGEAELLPVATSPDGEVTDELVDMYRAVLGEHPNWSEFRARMVEERRCVVRMTPMHAYGLLPRE